MSHAIAFDTLAYAKKLESSGIAVKQAEAHAEALANVLEFNFTSKNEANISYDKLLNVVKQESGETRQLFNQLEQKFGQLEHTVERKINELHHEINQNKIDLIKWVIGLAFAQTALTFSLLKFFHI